MVSANGTHHTDEGSKSMKKLIGAILGFVLLAGCGASTGTQSTTEPAASGPAASATATTGETPAEGSNEEPASDRKYAVTIDGARVTKDYEGKSALIVNFTFTNNSEDAANFMFAVRAKAFQDGIELESAMLIGNKKYDSANSMKDIKPGKSIKVQSAFTLDNKKSDVELEVTELISLDSTPLATKTITLK